MRLIQNNIRDTDAELDADKLIERLKDLSANTFIDKIDELNENKKFYIENMEKSTISNGIAKVIEVIEKNIKK